MYILCRKLHSFVGFIRSRVYFGDGGRIEEGWTFIFSLNEWRIVESFAVGTFRHLRLNRFVLSEQTCLIEWLARTDENREIHDDGYFESDRWCFARRSSETDWTRCCLNPYHPPTWTFSPRLPLLLLFLGTTMQHSAIFYSYCHSRSPSRPRIPPFLPFFWTARL